MKFKGLLFLALLFAGSVCFGQTKSGMSVNVLSSTSESVRLEFVFNGYDQQDVKIDGENYLYLSAPGFIWMMEKGKPQIPVYKNSITISDYAAMNFRILSEESDIINTGKIMPSKGHMTRDIDINMVPFTFDRIYSSDEYYPSNTVSIDDPYIIRDLRGMTFEINPLQYNAAQGKMKVYKKLVVEFYNDRSKQAVNVFNRLNPLNQVSGEFAPIYREMFLNYGYGQSRYDSIPEPGKMLIICPTAYMTAIQPLVAWKQQRGLNVTVAEYPTATGTGNTAIKTYIQNMYNSTGSVTYIILVGDVADIPTMTGNYEAAPSDPCYVKLAGTDAYPDAFISRISCQNAASVNYVCQKFIKYERDIELGAAWYKKGAGIGGPDAGGTPSYTDSARMNFIRDTLMANGFTSVDKIYPPGGTIQTILNSLNEGRYILNYIGHGSGTSWSNTGFSTTNVYQLNNGWKEPFILDVACLNGNLTLSECLEEAWLRAGDTANPKGAVTAFGASTNASWVPPCDMQTEAVRLFAHQYRKTAGSIAFFGVMKGMDLWGGSTGEGLKLMEQYNLFGDCSLLLTRGVPLGPSITHSPLTNTENLSGPYVINCSVIPANAPIKPNTTKVLWSRNNATMTDSVLMTNTGGNNWTANIPGNGTSAIYRYCIKTTDTANRTAVVPGGNSYYQFTAATDIINPVITHTALTNTPKLQWPATVTATVTDNIGVDSVWVKWRKNSTTTKMFKLLNTGGTNYAAAFNSDTSQVAIGDTIYYRVFARDISSQHNADSTAQYSFTIINQANIIVGTGTTSSNFPFTTYWMDGRTNYLYFASELQVGPASIAAIGFNVITADPAPINEFTIKMQNTTATSISGFTASGWTTCYSQTYTLPGTGWQMINLTTPFQYTGGNLLVEICYNNSSYTAYSPVYCSSTTGDYWGRYGDLSTASGCGYTAWTSTTGPVGKANMKFTMNPGTTAVTPIGTTVPQSYSLAQNYPNPFNPVTKINFAIPKQGFVTLKVYDMLGREVTKLVNEVKQAGTYSVDFDATRLSSGVYFYKLEAGGFVDTKRMVLIK